MRLSTKLVLFNVWLLAASNLVVETGIAEAFGARVQPGAGEKFSAALEAAGAVGSGDLGGETLAGIFVAGTEMLSGVWQFVAAGPILFTNLGVPEAVVTFIFAPQAIIVAADTYYALSGRNV